VNDLQRNDSLGEI